MKHTISVLVENQSGVLTRIAGLFSARAFNIDSLAVGETDDPAVSRMTIVSQGDDRVIEQIIKQLNKLIDVIKVKDITEEEIIERELVLVKVASVSAQTRNELMQIVNTFRAKVVDVNPKTVTIEVTGNESKVDAMLELMQPFHIKEVARTGAIALARGSEGLRIEDKEKVKVKSGAAKPSAKKKSTKQ